MVSKCPVVSSAWRSRSSASCQLGQPSKYSNETFMVFVWVGLQLGDELLRRHRLGEHRVVVGEGVLVLLDRGRSDAVAQGDHLVAVLIAAAHRRLDAAVGEEATEHERLDSLAAQDEIKVGAGESVQPPLALDDDVALLGSHLVGDRPPQPPLMNAATSTTPLRIP